MTSELTTLKIAWSASPIGGPPDYYNVMLMNGATTVDELKSTTTNQSVFSNLSSNALYKVNITSINCASFNTSTWPAYTCKLHSM